MITDLGHQEIVEQHHVLLLLLGRGEAPEASETEMRDVVDVNGRINNLLQLGALFRRRSRAIGDGHQPVARALDESNRLGARLRERVTEAPWGNQRPTRSERDHCNSACKHGTPSSQVSRQARGTYRGIRDCR